MTAKKRWHPKRCKGCGKPATARRHISARGWCGPCGLDREQAALRQLAGIEDGEHVAKWRRRMRETFGGDEVAS